MVKDFDIRKYTIRLTKDGLKVPVTKRASRALVTIKKFVEKNTRAERGNVLIGEELNEFIWSQGRKNIPRKVKVFVQNMKNETVFVNLEGAPIKVLKKKEDKDKKKEKKEEEKKKDSLENLTEDFKTDEKKEEKKEAKKKVEKKDTKKKKEKVKKPKKK